MDNIKSFMNNNNIKIRSLTNIIGCVLLFAAGLFYVLFIDLYVKFKNETGADNSITPISIWLFFAIVFAVGGGIFYFFGDSQKHKPVQTLVLKGIGIVLAIGYIFFIAKFNSWVDASNKVMPETVSIAHTLANVSLILDIVGLVVVIINYVLSIIFVKEDY